jgi:hypothetical protein
MFLKHYQGVLIVREQIPHKCHSRGKGPYMVTKAVVVAIITALAFGWLAVVNGTRSWAEVKKAISYYRDDPQNKTKRND